MEEKQPAKNEAEQGKTEDREKDGFMDRRIIIGVAVLLVGAGGTFAVAKRDSRARVETILPQKRDITETIALTGEFRGLTETNVGAQINGRIVAMFVKEGDRVKRGQQIARLDDAVLVTQISQAEEAEKIAQGQIEQAQDALKSAQAQRVQAARPALASELERVRADTRQNVAVAQAKLAAAREHYAELQRGDTSEQRDQITAQVAQAQAALNFAEKDYRRQRDLYQQGAISAATFDVADTNRESARLALANLQARQRQQQVGTRKETLEQARADIQAAEATVAGAQATGNAQLQTLLAQPRAEDVLVADAHVREAQRAREVALLKEKQIRTGVELAVRQRRDSLVTAPFDGTVTKIVTEVGGVASASQALVRLVKTGRPEIRADMDEKYLGRVKVGQEAIITADAYPGQQVVTHIRELGAQVDNTRGTIEVRLDPATVAPWLRPNQTLSVNVIVARNSPRLLLPLSSVISVGGTSWAYAVENGLIVKKPLDADATSQEGVPVKSGVSETDRVVLAPNGVKVGASVVAVPASKQSLLNSNANGGTE